MIVFHEYEAFEYHLSRYRYLSAQYDGTKVIEILENLPNKTETVLIRDTCVGWVLEPTIERLGPQKVEVARFEMDSQVETEQRVIVLYKLQQSKLAWTESRAQLAIDFTRLSHCDSPPSSTRRTGECPELF